MSALMIYLWSDPQFVGTLAQTLLEALAAARHSVKTTNFGLVGYPDSKFTICNLGLVQHKSSKEKDMGSSHLDVAKY